MDQPAVMQAFEVSGDVGLGGADGLDDPVHGQFTAHQGLEDGQTGGVAEHGEPSRHLVQDGSGHLDGLGGHSTDMLKALDTIKHITI